MNSIRFCYWLQGYFELCSAEALSPKQVQIIRDHLDLASKTLTLNGNTGIQC